MIFAHKSDYPKYGLNFKTIPNLNFKGKIRVQDSYRDILIF